MSGILVLLAFIIAFAAAAVLGPVCIPFLVRLKVGQSIREEGPSWHQKKANTPTMGGIIFIASTVLVSLGFGFQSLIDGDMRLVLIMLMALAFGFIGFLDDYIKVVKKRNLGLTAKQKFLLQCLVGAAFLASLKLGGYLPSTEIFIPFFNVQWEVGFWYYVFAMLTVVGFVNATNLTDGLDGLAATTALPVALCFTVLAFLFRAAGVTYWGAAFLGGLAGFLLVNRYPAKVFMGDTGSLFIGGALCGMAFAFNLPVILLLAGALFVWETITVMLQVVWFKLTKGKRLFRMAPWHHHLEMGGWKETKIVAFFGVLSFLLSGAAFIGTYLYYFAH